MAGNAGFGDDPLGPGCYSQLLFSDDGCFDFTSSIDNDTSRDSPKMLCFGDHANGNQKPVFTCMDSPPKSISVMVQKKRNGSDIQNAGYCAGNQRNCKKPKSENSTGGHAKVVKKEKLGERITALQQLVSPFGKTDTASVLHEALGYIRFLHDQVQVLSSPYLQRFGAPNSSEDGDGDCRKREKMKHDMRSRGLCLVPVDLTLHVAESNGADLWSSAPVMHT